VPRSNASHQWVIFKIALAFFGIVGVGDTHSADLPEISAYVSGFRIAETFNAGLCVSQRKLDFTFI
jgi:hypothetical protein